MEEKKPKTKEILIDGESYELYDVTVKGRQVYVAPPLLYKKINECIINGMYHENICQMDGKTCTIRDVDDTFQYVYNDFENNMTPSEKDVIECVEDSMNFEEQVDFYREFNKAVMNGNKQFLYMDKQTNQIHSLIETAPGSNKYISANYTERISDERLAQMVNINDRITDVVLINQAQPAIRCKIDGQQQMATKLDADSKYTLYRMNVDEYPKTYIQEYLRLKAAEMHFPLLLGIDESRSQNMKR